MLNIVFFVALPTILLGADADPHPKTSSAQTQSIKSDAVKELWQQRLAKEKERFEAYLEGKVAKLTSAENMNLLEKIGDFMSGPEYEYKPNKDVDDEKWSWFDFLALDLFR